ncbi:SDR family oxidoreductase [Micromonospora sp. DT53]|uniref:SDR family oxidoreductase n=1 Tax=Micromonospora sp. DT53 TaxID=3393444 RepID=UPI003CEDC547
MTEQRVAVVSGASSGIGRAVAAHFVRRGIRVVAAGRNVDELAKLVDELSGEPGEVRTVCADVTEPDHPERLLAAAEDWGPVSIVVLSAGQGLPGTVLGSDPDRWRELVEVNYLAVLHQLRASGAYLRARAEADGGRQVRDIVVIGSTVGRQVSAANPVYGSTKFAVHSLVEALRQEVCVHNVRVSLIEPGFVRSGFQEAAGYDMTWFEKVIQENGPLLTPDDVAETVGFVVDRPAHVHLDDIRLRPTRQRV